MGLEDDGSIRVVRLSDEKSNAVKDKRLTGLAHKTANDSGTDCGAVKQNPYAIRTLKDQVKTLAHAPDNKAMRRVVAANVARLEGP